MGFSPLLILLALGLWGLLHSFLASLTVKARARQWFGDKTERWYRLAYNFIAVLTLLPVAALLKILPDEVLYVIPLPWLNLAIFGQLLAILGLIIGLMQTGVGSFLGFKQLVLFEDDNPSEINNRGFYKYVRHPLYTTGLALIWLMPVMSGNLLALNIGLTAYLIVGTIFEERKLLRQYGEAYAQYQQRVPMLVPGLKRRR